MLSYGIYLSQNFIILCTFNNETYPNEWLDDNKLILKYYLEGRLNKTQGKKIFNKNYKSNRVIIESAISGYPIHVFTREKKRNPFQYEGKFYFQNVVKETEAKYFELIRVTENTVKFDEDFLNEEMDSYTTVEGRKVLRQHYARERDPYLIKLAKERFIQKHGRLFCEVCGFDFVEVYGELGKGFIEGHHIVPISELDSSGEITRVEDIILLCSNCHRMIHRCKPSLPINKFKSLVKKFKMNR